MEDEILQHIFYDKLKFFTEGDEDDEAAMDGMTAAQRWKDIVKMFNRLKLPPWLTILSQTTTNQKSLNQPKYQ